MRRGRSDDGREGGRTHRSGACAVSGRAVLAGDPRERIRLRFGPARPPPDHAEIVGEDIGEQTEQVFDNLQAILEEAGSGLDRIVKTTVFLTDLGDFAGMNEVYARRVGQPPPARATVEISNLPSGAKVEIEAIALA